MLRGACPEGTKGLRPEFTLPFGKLRNRAAEGLSMTELQAFTEL
jgi:hypothetical protein